MSERSDLRKDYTIMENKLDKFINYEDKFVDWPQFYSELLNLSYATGNSVDKALSVSEE